MRLNRESDSLGLYSDSVARNDTKTGRFNLVPGQVSILSVPTY